MLRISMKLERLTRIGSVLVFVATGLTGWVMEVRADDAGAGFGSSGAVLRDGRAEHSVPDEGVLSPAMKDRPADGVLTLRFALEQALARNPELAAVAEGVKASEGRSRQAAAWPNPELELLAAEFGGSGARTGYDSAESSVAISQTVELGGKRGLRRAVAQSEARLAGWDLESKRLEIATRTKQAYIDAQVAQGRVALADSLRGVAEGVLRAAGERVKSGKVPVLEEVKAGVEVATARIGYDRARREFEMARIRLATLMGESAAWFTNVAGSLDCSTNALQQWKATIVPGELPEVATRREAVLCAKESLSLAQATRIPDLSVNVGASRFEEDASYAASVGLSIPLPVLDLNEGAILEARANAARAEWELRASELRATVELTEGLSRVEMAMSEAMAMQKELLPAVQQAFDAAQAGYREGKLGHLDVLDSQRTLTEARMRHLEVLGEYHKAAADVERLSGLPSYTAN